MKEILRENKYLIILWILCIAGLLAFCGHYSEIMIDFGREVYYPEQILHGKIMYKDLFNIYGPLAYQINAVLYKIFGVKLSTLYGAGCICSMLIVSGIYLISKRFLTEFLSFCTGILTIAVGVTTTSIFNFHFPYSWSVLYGLCAFLYSLLFLLKFNDSKKMSYLCISSFLAGVCITCKYDFLLYGFVILFFIIRTRNWKTLISLFLAPLLSFGILFLQGLRLNDIINTLSITADMAKSKTLIYFYQNSGIYFHWKAIPEDLLLFFKTTIPFCGILFSINLYEKKKNFATTIFLSSAVLMIYFFNPRIMFGFLPLFLFIFAAASYKKINTDLVILTISALAACAKVFWVLLLGSYGNYYISIAITAVLALLFVHLPKKFEKSAGIYLITLSILLFSYSNMHLSQIIETPKGKVITGYDLKTSTNNLIKYITDKTKPTDKIVIFPEGMIINFLADRQTDGFYNSMLPLYVETFGEDKFIRHFKSNLPEYIILNNLDMKDYYFRFICQDYAIDFCAFVQENYELQKIIEGNFRYMVFKRK